MVCGDGVRFDVTLRRNVNTALRASTSLELRLAKMQHLVVLSKLEYLQNVRSLECKSALGEDEILG